MNSSTKSLLIIGLLFFLFGFVTWLNSVLIPFLGISCELTNFQSFFVTFAFYIAYFVTALPSAKLLEKTGLKKGISTGLVVMALGSLLFIPAAYSRSFVLFLIGLFVQGTGLSIMQTATNPYVTMLGSIESAAKRISIMGICNKLAGALSPIILSAALLKDSSLLSEKISLALPDDKIVLLNEMASKIVMPYIIIFVVLAILALLINFSPLPEVDAGEKEDKKTSILDVLKFRHLVLGVISLFLYVGVEVLAGDSVIRYAMSQNIQPVYMFGINIADYTLYTTYTLISMIVGYILGIVLVPNYLSQSKMLAVCAIIGISFSLLVIIQSGFVSVLFVALLGLANAMMWPTIFPLAISKLGVYTKTGSALLIMAIAGGAIIPLIYGKLADSIGLNSAYIILIPCYAFILYFAIRGSKTGN